LQLLGGVSLQPAPSLQPVGQVARESHAPSPLQLTKQPHDWSQVTPFAHESSPLQATEQLPAPHVISPAHAFRPHSTTQAPAVAQLRLPVHDPVPVQ
jgi:hypothetical protein